MKRDEDAAASRYDDRAAEEIARQARAERAERIEALLHEIVELWPGLEVGEVNLNVLYARGRVRRAYVHYGPIRPAELGSPFIGLVS